MIHVYSAHSSMMFQENTPGYLLLRSISLTGSRFLLRFNSNAAAKGMSLIVVGGHGDTHTTEFDLLL